MEMDENLEELKELINDSFLDKNLKCRLKFNEETLEEEIEEYVTLKSIVGLKLSEEEEVFIIDYLGTLGISVSGIYSYYSGICDNYRQSRNFAGANAYVLSKEEQKECLEEYQRTKDIEVRNLIVESNLPFVKYLSRKSSYRFDIEQEFLESYGVEGLIKAIDDYDSKRGKFSTFLSLKIKAFIFGGIVISCLGQDGYTYLNRTGKRRSEDTKYFEYFYTKAKVEKQTEKRLKNDPDLVEVIAHLLEERGYCEGENLEELKIRVSANNPYSYEQIEDDLCYFDDDALYGEIVEKVFQQELAEYIEDIIEELPEKKKEALRSYYGLGGQESNTLEGIGKVEGVTRETIRLRCEDGKQILKKMMNSWYWQRSSITKSFLENCNHEYENNVYNAYIKRK